MPRRCRSIALRRVGGRLRADSVRHDVWPRREHVATVEYLVETDGDKTGTSLPLARVCTFVRGLRPADNEYRASLDRHF